jgi:serine/threonine-protein kinase
MGIADKFRSLFQSSTKLDVSKRFEILREAVSGTMSKFYKARDRESGEIVGVKICDIEKTSFFEGRFTGLEKPSEGEIASQFRHPRIVRTREYGITTNDEHYLIMDFLDGPGLNAFIFQKSSQLDGKRVNLIREMCQALDVVHQADFIHRDICPRNFICAKDAGSLRLIDFGLTVPARKEFMQGGNRSGTPNYMAPEIIRRKPTDKRLDIFALGVTAYQLCTFELPWPSQDVSGKAAVAHDNKPPVDIFQVRPQLDPTLGAAIMQCLRRNPADRPQTVPALVRMIRNVTDEDA